jgi:threonine-phosphate decarboxylase
VRPADHGGDVFAHPYIRLDCSVNLGPLGLPPAVQQAIRDHVADFAAYPDPECRALRAAIARHDGVAPAQVLCGNGATDLIYRLCTALRPRRVLVLAPTFSEYERAARLAGAEITHHRLHQSDNFAVSETVLTTIAPGLDLVFICQPNNPTGQLVDLNLMNQIVRRCAAIGAVLVCDECFLPFTTGASLLPRAAAHPGLVILRAFTKIYALAGLRLGYLVSGDQPLLDAVARAGPPWSVSAVAQVAGQAALEVGGWAEQTRAVVAAERAYLAAALTNLGLHVYPSDANYLLFTSPQPLFEPLLAAGVLIRPCDNYIGLDTTFYRTCVGPRADNTQLIEAIREVLYGPTG